MKCSSCFADSFDRMTGAYIFGHTSPDGDCVSSALSIWYALKKKGKKSVIFTDGAEKFEDQRGRICSLCPETAVFSQADVRTELLPADLGDRPYVIIVDCPGFSRTGVFAGIVPECPDICKLPMVVIDHHQHNGSVLDSDFIVPQSTSAAELCFDVVTCVMRVGLDTALSGVLFYGIASDTGFFKFVHADGGSDTFRKVSECIEHGIGPDAVNAALNYGNPPESDRYLASLIERTEFLCGGRVACAVDDKFLFDSYGSLARPSNEYYNVMLSTKGVQVVVLVKYSDEKDFVEGSVRVGFFSKFNAVSFCRIFGGGGHEKAAAFHVRGDFDSVVADVRKKIQEFF